MPRVDLVDPTEEGKVLSALLRSRGLSVVDRAPDVSDLGASAEVVVIAADVPGALPVARRLCRSRERSYRVVALGTGRRGAPIVRGADARFPRPLALDRIVDRVLELIRDPSSVPVTWSGVTEPAVGTEDTEATGDIPLPRPVERTMELGQSSDALAQGTPAAALDPPGVSPAGLPGRAAETPSWQAAAVEALAAGTELPPSLRELVLAADRRLFAGAAQLAWTLPAGEESARELVPDELLDELGAPLLFPEPDLVEVRREPLAGASGARRVTPVSLSAVSTAGSDAEATEVYTRRPRARATPVHLRSPASPLPASSPEPLAYEGTVDRRGLVGLALELASRGHSAALTLRPAGGAPVGLTVRGGDVLVLEVRAARVVHDELVLRGRLGGAATDELDAARRLEDAVRAKLLGRLELERLLRAARERAVGDCMASDRIEVGRVAAEAPAADAALPATARPLLALFAEGARRHVTPGDLFRLLGSRTVGLRALPAAPRVFREAGVEPDVATLLAHAGPVTVSELLDDADAEDGLPGLLFLLVTAGAFAPVAVPLPVPGGRRPLGPAAEERARAELERLERLAFDGDYFELLGVARDVTSRELSRAYAERRARIVGLDPDAAEVRPLARARESVLSALEEAYEALRDAALRVAYAEALET